MYQITANVERKRPTKRAFSIAFSGKVWYNICSLKRGVAVATKSAKYIKIHRKKIENEQSHQTQSRNTHR